ncbi:SMI1/KNR4 family protein [Bernardetia sp. Wsw4-3y2]|uniref:SMI1/KNR4 family protein n=1 Tax=Bernardetia sp. Wsw4-3y2 TaxID=3127471 RepID=UPI0030CEEE06
MNTDYQKLKSSFEKLLPKLKEMNDEYNELFKNDEEFEPLFRIESSSEKEILDLEHHIQSSIIEPYRSFIKDYNPSIEISCDGRGVRLLGIKEMKEEFDNTYEFKELLSENIFPIALDGSGNYFVVKTEKENQFIYWINHDKDFSLSLEGKFIDIMIKWIEEEL